MKKLFLLFIGVALSSTLMASGWFFSGGNHHNGDRSHPDENNDAYIEQWGIGLSMFKGNDAYIDQTGAENAKAYILQVGFDNEAYIGQTGKDNVAGGELNSCLKLCCEVFDFWAEPESEGLEVCVDVRDVQVMCGEWVTEAVHIDLPWVGFGITECGFDLSASIEQCGKYNAAGVKLEGAGLNAAVEQGGEGNTSLVNMEGWDVFCEESYVKHVQNGKCNFAYTSLESHGGDNKALIIQDDAKDNVAIQVAEGKDLTLGILQDGEGCRDGDDNVAVQVVDGNKISAFIMQYGDDNKAVELVAGKCNESGILQIGDNNNAMIKQGCPEF